MKKILSMLIALSMIISSMTMMSVSAEEAVKEETNVVWIGGSYTAGAGYDQRTDELPEGVTAMPFAKQVTNWIAENSEGTVNYHNVAIGGTPSPYGRNRFEKDVLSKNPDIVFVEFTSNDESLASAKHRVSYALEGMVRAVQDYEKENNKEVKIAFLYRVKFGSAEGMAYDANRSLIDTYHAIADYYDVYEIDTAEESKRLWEADGIEYSSMVASDGAHPTALGHYYMGKAMISVLEKNPITHHKYRSIPMNVNYTDISPIYIDASDEAYIDRENTIGFAADGTKMISSNAGDKITYKFHGTSVGVVLDKDVSAKVWIYVDGKAYVNGSAGRTELHTQELEPGEHTLEYINEGGGEVVIRNIIVDGIANEGMEAKDTYTRNIYEDTCVSKDSLAGRTIHHCYVHNFNNSLYNGSVFSFYPGWEDKKVITYQLDGTTDFEENSNITNVNIRYTEYGHKDYADKNIEVRAIDENGTEIKAFFDEDVIYEKIKWSAEGSTMFDLKVYNFPAEATGIVLYLHNNNNTCLTNIKIAYAEKEIDGISLDLDKKWVPIGENVATIISQYANNGQKEAVGEGAVISFASSDDSVATVDENGFITGVSEGFAVIKAIAEIDGDTYTTTKVVEVKDIKDYTDTEPKEIPLNLITSVNVLNNTGGNAGIASVTGVGYKYTVTDSTTAGAWNVFPPSALTARNSKGNSTPVNLDYYKAGTTYVYKAKVKNASEDSTLTPYYGIAIPAKNTYGYSDAVGSNEYGKDGMPIISTEWTEFKATITFPEKWNEASMDGAVGQKIFAGVGKKSDVGAAVIIDTTVGDSLYLAEEAANDIKFTAENDEAVLAQDGTLKVKAEVINQIGLPGTLDQTVEWAVVSEDRTDVIENIKTEVSENTITLSCDDTLPLGRYTLVAVSDKYDITKGWEFDVVVDISIKYKDYQAPKMPENLITSINVLNNTGGNAGLASVTGVGYKYTVTDSTIAGAWNVFPPSAFVARNSKGNSTPVNLDYYKAGTTYVYKAKVKNASEDSTLTPYYGIAIPAKNDYSYNNGIGSNEYGKDGMPITSTEWTEFKATITFPEKWNEASTDAVVGQKIFAGVGKKSDVGAAVMIDTTIGDSLYLAEEVLYDISNEVVSGETTINKTSDLTLKSELTNQIGLKGGLNQDVTWLALSADRKEIIDSIIIAEDEETGFATVSVTENTPLGNYVILAYSEGYKAAKGIEITVADKKESKATLMLSQDSGYVWLEADVFDAECEKVTFIIAAYSKDENGKLTLLKVKTQQENVTDGVAGIEELWLDDYEEVPTGTIVKAFAWESDSQKPIIATDGSIKEFIIE